MKQHSSGKEPIECAGLLYSSPVSVLALGIMRDETFIRLALISSEKAVSVIVHQYIDINNTDIINL